MHLYKKENTEGKYQEDNKQENRKRKKKTYNPHIWSLCLLSHNQER